MSKSIFWAYSARTGELLSFKSQFERDIWQLAELDSTVGGYSFRSPTFSYYDGKRQRKGEFFLMVEKRTGEKELWSPLDDRASLERPVEKARSTFARLLEMPYRPILRAGLYSNQIAVMNRRTIMGVLSTNLDKQDSGELETAVLTTVTQGKQVSLASLAKQLAAELDAVLLAVFRLYARGFIAGDEDRYIGPSWKIRRALS